MKSDLFWFRFIIIAITDHQEPHSVQLISATTLKKRHTKDLSEKECPEDDEECQKRADFMNNNEQDSEKMDIEYESEADSGKDNEDAHEETEEEPLEDGDHEEENEDTDEKVDDEHSGDYPDDDEDDVTSQEGVPLKDNEDATDSNVIDINVSGDTTSPGKTVHSNTTYLSPNQTNNVSTEINSRNLGYYVHPYHTVVPATGVVESNFNLLNKAPAPGVIPSNGVSAGHVVIAANGLPKPLIKNVVDRI